MGFGGRKTGRHNYANVFKLQMPQPLLRNGLCWIAKVAVASTLRDGLMLELQS